MRTYNTLKQKLQDKRQSLYDWAGGEGSIRNTEITPRGLAGVACAGVIAVTGFGCSVDHSQYEFNEKIGEDQVEFVEEISYPFLFNTNILTEVKADGRIIKYKDIMGDDLKLEYVDITKNGQTTTYNSTDKIVFTEAQENCDTRMKQILEINTNKKKQIKENRIRQGLEDLK